MLQQNRRNLVKSALAMTLLGGGVPQGLARPVFTRYPFTLGIAAGDPAQDGFVIWTRLAPDPQTPGGGMPPADVAIRWEVSEDPDFRKVARAGTALAEARLAHSVHVEVEGLLPRRPYWYRFLVHGAGTSPIGMARTAPGRGMPVDQVRLVMAGCQNFEMGYYTAFARLAQEPNVDAVYHYGDYLYEMGIQKAASPRKHLTGELYTLDDYRRRYAQYKADPDLQAAHAAAAFILSFDDHEIDDNWAAKFDKDGSPAEVFAIRKAAALQAWYEHMPVRRALMPGSNGVRMYRRLDYGSLVRVHVLDTRSYRSDQACERPGLSRAEIERCYPVDRPDRTILGAAQERWLDEGLSNQARWNFLAQQVMVMPHDSRRDGATSPVASADNWNGYSYARQRLVDSIRRKGLTNVVIGSGDAHQNYVGVVPLEIEDLEGPAIATEFLATSISSGGTGGLRLPDEQDGLFHNPHMKLLNNQRGYHLFTISPDRWQTEIKVIDQVDRPNGNLSTLAAFLTHPGRPGAEAV
ncbi:alkaline phosphatase [Sphingomonas suaedae]|uniref:Alkaline phosphatase n=1 Tax=Sphingomonas suaedae TaxID=2599297 RepID=A0A518RHL5_9SPHN|nr:alkaline phosphatase D family protein [Sphingomonas suaedae]QDX26940.1 alkaline phosphatase [Sphingomonas suaedae]